MEAQIERHRDQIVAFKAYLGYLHFGPEDPQYVPYYRIAAKYHFPVIFHGRQLVDDGQAQVRSSPAR